ncbi:MAG: MFS transporter [Bacteroidales bacterium]|nr:MFS transporter [Bacteroidales bacterium]
MAQSSLQKSLLASVCNFLAAGAIVASGSGLKYWEQYLGLTTMDSGWLNALSANGIGAAVGAFFGGFLADRYGRSNVFSFNMLFYLLGTLFIMSATSFAQLMTGTIVTGIAAGISVPASWTYICECSGTNHRARNIALSQAAWGLGPAVVLMLSYIWAPGGPCFSFVQDTADMFGIRANRTFEVNIFASRIVFAILFVIAFLAWMFQRHLEPSREWAANRDSINRNESIFKHLPALFKGKFGKISLGLVGMYLTWNLVAGAMGFFQGHIYETAGKLSNAVTNRILADQWFFTVAITAIGAFFIDRFKHRTLLVVFSGIGCLTWLIVALIGIETFAGTIFVTLLWAIQAGISVQLFFALWGVELFPFAYRAAAIGVMFCIVRLLSALGGLGFSIVWESQGGDFISIGSIVMILFLGASTYIGWKIAPETRGKTMDEITKEQYGE